MGPREKSLQLARVGWENRKPPQSKLLWGGFAGERRTVSVIIGAAVIFASAEKEEAAAVRIGIAPFHHNFHGKYSFLLRFADPLRCGSVGDVVIGLQVQQDFLQLFIAVLRNSGVKVLAAASTRAGRQQDAVSLQAFGIQWTVEIHLAGVVEVSGLYRANDLAGNTIMMLTFIEFPVRTNGTGHAVFHSAEAFMDVRQQILWWEAASRPCRGAIAGRAELRILQAREAIFR